MNDDDDGMNGWMGWMDKWIYFRAGEKKKRIGRAAGRQE